MTGNETEETRILSDSDGNSIPIVDAIPVKAIRKKQQKHGMPTGNEKVGYGKPPVHSRFSSEHQPLPENRGRYPSKLNGFIKDNKIDCTDVSKIIKNVIFDHSELELMEMLKDKETPMLVRLFIRAYIEDFKNGTLQNIETLLNRSVGRPKIDMDISASLSGEINHNVTAMTPEERKKRLDALLKKRKVSK